MTMPGEGLLRAISPIDGRVVAERPLASADALERALAGARTALSEWSRVPVDTRAALLTRAVDAFAGRRAETAAEITWQMGRPLHQSPSEIDGFEERARHMIALATVALADLDVGPKPGFRRFIRREPLGVVLVVAPWNYPYLTAVNSIVPALMAGNVVLLKHSAQTPLCAERLSQAFAAAGLPDGVFQQLHMGHDLVASAVGDRRVDFVAFTGSVEGGRAVYQSAAKSLLDAGLELGGKDPAYVASDADLKFAVENIVDGACYNAGQSCCAIERVYVHCDLYDRFLEAAAEKLGDYRLGDPLDDSTTMGPLASGNALDVLDAQVADATKRGARLLLGGHRIFDSPGNFFQPTLLADCPQDSLVMQEESFGPLLPVAMVDDDHEAIERMNDSPLGLTASIWTRDLDRAERFGREIEAGTIFQNRADYIDPSLPWTGWKQSGLGSTLSPYGFHHLTRRKAIHFRIESGS